MHVFISAGEPSGDLHGANLIRALKARSPDLRVSGFGGERMELAGAELLYPLTRLAVMGISRVVANLRTFFRLGRQAEEFFRAERPDAVVLIDYPGFHFPIAKRAHAAGIPVYFFVPPQLWGWKGWRVKKVRRWFSAVLTALPFEEEWYRARGVRTQYIGHPFYDELARQRLDEGFLADQRGRPGPVVALLPGSRNQEVARNFPMMLDAAARIHRERPDVRFLVASFSAAQCEAAKAMAAGRDLPIEFHVGRTPEVVELAHSCIAVSGSVSLELMYRLKPTVVVYRMNWVLGTIVKSLFLRVRYITLVNLLANEELFPEYPTRVDRSRELAAETLAWLNDPAAHAERVEKLRRLKDVVARPGACARAAEFLLAEATDGRARPAAA